MPKNGNMNQCTIIITRDCNLRCEFCYAKSAGYNADDRISFNNIKKVIDFCGEARMKYIVFTGGEPLKYPQLDETLLYIKEQQPQLTVAIPTNGLLLSEKSRCEELIGKGVKYFDISIKGKDSQSWLNTTGIDGFKYQLKAIRNLSELQVDFTCSMVVTNENVKTFIEAVRIAHDNGATAFSFTFFIDNEDSSVKDLRYLEKQNPFLLVSSFVSQMDDLNDITDDWWIEYSFPLCIYSEEQLALLKNRLATPCQVHLQNSVTFDSQLNLLPCDMYIGRSMGKLGSDFNTYSEFLELMEDEKYRITIDSIKDRPSAECSSCRYYERCRGGCPVLWKNYSYDALKTFRRHV